MLKPLTLVLLALLPAISFCQTRNTPKPVIKSVIATRTDASIKIDGQLDEADWANAKIATDFIELRPNPGKTEKRDRRTEVKLLYDNTAIYVGAKMFDEPDSISKEIVTRDLVGNSDFIGVVFDTYYDKINGYGFFVTASGSQFDAKYSLTGNEDPNWNAVWESNVKINEDGWTAEFKIPYSALRFADKPEQLWGLNYTRKRQIIQQQTFWNFVDPKVNGFINQEGQLLGLSNIKAPLRLSFSPYVSSYVNNYPANQPGIKNTTGSFNGGMDVKYGINQSFTLDMTLVPDFGQVQSDNQVLNLSPFEVKYDERRQFFTEGTELFSKGDLFYSRRIGSTPLNYGLAESSIGNGETLVSNPSESRLLNATKLSGRTGKGLGVGIFNAVTKRMRAEIESNLGNTRYVETQPLTNYNIFVLDQSLKNNSSVTFINTNVLRKGSAYDANATGLLFSLNDKSNKYFINGSGRMTYLSDQPSLPSNYGFSYELGLGKQSGSFTYGLRSSITDDKFNPNDLGILYNNNYFDNSLNLGYGIYKPGKWYNQLQTWLNINHSMRYKPLAYQSIGFYTGSYIQFKNLWSLEIDLDWQPQGNDFYEPRNSGRVFKSAATEAINIYANTNRSKKYNAGIFGGYRKNHQFDGAAAISAGFFQNYRINNKLSLGTDFDYEPKLSYAGWAAAPNGTIIFSRYDRQTIENSIDAKYAFNSRMGITFRARHYWSSRDNQQFYTLQTDGNLAENSSYSNQKLNQNYNAFNIDMIYTWQFAPGSELSFAWKDASLTNQNNFNNGYFGNAGYILSAPQNNSLSVKVLYYIDYLNLKSKK